MAQQKSKLPSNQGLSRELIAYHQGNEDKVSALQSAVDNFQSTTIDGVSGDVTLGYGLDTSGQQLFAGFTSFTAALSGDVNLNNTANYFSGPSVAQGTTGTWFVIGHVQVTSATEDNFDVKLWDGTTVIAAASEFTFSSNITLAGVITSPAGDLRIDAKDRSTTSGIMRANTTSNGNKDSTIMAVRIA